MELNFPAIEKRILEFWEKNQIFQKLRKKIQGNPHWSFLDGPITANNPMGVHHAWGRTYKDLFQRYKAMQGFDQRFQNGFDCQGLWVEVEVEKELGFKTKKDIEKYGIDKFVVKCKERVLKYSKIQTEQSIRLGQWMDWDNSYYTMSDENNYTIWHFLKKCWQDELLYKGRDVVPWCLRCGTAISQHEILTEEYKEISHKAVFVRLPISGEKNTFFLVWTTTPWTLPANVALAVHPDLQYSRVKDKQGYKYVLLKDKVFLIENGEILETFPGRKLQGMFYEGMFDDLPSVKEAMKTEKHKVILWDEITVEEGTGIVHIAPGCGQEDFQLSKKFNLPIIDPLDEESRYKTGFGFLAEKLASEVAELIFEILGQKSAVYKIENYLHRYPTCWRCKSELIFRLVDEWYISMQKLRKPLMDVTKKIRWIPDFGLERELDWLKNMQDWLISKKRYWGLALPIFECRCGHFEVMGSKEELEKRAVEGWNEFEGHTPHRPWIDKVKIKCSKCANLVSRIADVGNPWLDAGIVSFSTIKYFTDKDYWKAWFPADFICESFPGQFKNWFYSLIVMSTVLENKNPTKTIFGFASVRDEKGEEMHKSKGNAIEFNTAAEKIGADVMRWMYAKQNPADNLKFGFQAAEETKRRLLTFYNVFLFFKTYVEKDYFIKKEKNGPASRAAYSVLDEWVTSRVNTMLDKATKDMDRYDVSSAVLAVEDFFINDLSLWYIRRSRHKFHTGSIGRDVAIRTLYYVLLDLTKIMSPIMPFFAEEIYQNLRLDWMPESVHLAEWPRVDRIRIKKDLEEKMETTRQISALVLAERAKAGIKVRQPLAKLKINSKRFKIDKELLELVKEEANIKKIIFDSRIKKEIELDTKITPELRKEGIIREVIRNLQEMRKKAGLKPKDKISILYSGEEGLNKIIAENKKFIIEETLAKNLSFSKNIRSSPSFRVAKEKVEKKKSSLTPPFATARVLKGQKRELETEKEIEIDGIKLRLAIKKI